MNLYAHGFWVEPKPMKKRLTGKQVEQIVEAEGDKFDWGQYHDWLSDPHKTFLKPIILENGAVIWPYCQIHPKAEIGKEVVVGCFTNICGPVQIGDFTRMQGFNFIPAGVTIGEKVFVGPGVTFTNMKYATARFGRGSRQRLFENTIVEEGVSIGAGSVICPGVTIGKAAMIAAGSIVTRDVTEGWLVKGNPARHIRVFVDLEEEKKRAEKWEKE